MVYRHRHAGFVYNDCFMAQDVYIEAEQQTYLGWPPERLPERYRWGKVTLPKGKSWNKDAKHFKDGEYAFPKISLFDNSSDISSSRLQVDATGITKSLTGNFIGLSSSKAHCI